MASSYKVKSVTDSLNQSEKKKRYILFNHQDISEIWNHLILSVAINELKNEDPSLLEGNVVEFLPEKTTNKQPKNIKFILCFFLGISSSRTNQDN